MQNISILLLVPGFMLLQACRTTGRMARVDKDKHRFELQSQDDSKSAMQYSSDENINKELISKLESQVESNPRDLGAQINLSQAHLAIGQYDKADKVCRSALRIDPKNETARKTLAQIYYRRGNLEMANIILNGLDAINSKDSQILNLLGMIALRQNKPEFALQSFQEALKNNPSDIAVRMNLGVLYVHYRQLGLASVEFERVLKLMPEHPDANLHMAVIESNRGNLDKAEELYRKVLKNAENNPVAIYNLAVVEHRRKNYDKALDYLRTYLETDIAKKKNNQEVFAFIEKLRSEKEASTGKRVSDDEIMKLAAKAKAPSSEQATNNDKEFVEADSEIHSDKPSNEGSSPQKQPPASEGGAATMTGTEKEQKPEAKGKKSNKKANYKNDEDEIKDLEKQLK
ncbi:MAG: tetratricopeptide repeat protein [Proteobacteria bacterium]|nr:tetratricopeptide repeat protein [Pseudomonadota bacterium]